MVSIRNVIPFVLTLVAAGVGHFFLRHWKRGGIWLGLYLLTLTFFSGYSPFQIGMPRLFLVGVFGVELSPVDVMFPLAILILCLLDVYAIVRNLT